MTRSDCPDDLVDSCIRGLANTVNLQSFAWTWNGVLNSSIFPTILKHRSLQELEISGQHLEENDHAFLPQFTSVRRIELLSPSPSVIGVLPAWFKSLADPLQSLSIVGTAFDIDPTRLLNPGQNSLILLSQMNC